MKKEKGVKVKVGGVYYTIYFSSDPFKLDPQASSPEAFCWGLCDERKHTCRILDNGDKHIMGVSLFHELTHAILNEYHIKNMRDDDSSAHNEDAVDLMGQALKGILESLGIDLISILKAKIK